MADGVSRQEWRYVSHASADDFKLLVANEEWKVLDALADKVRYWGAEDGMHIELTDGQRDFLDLYDALVEHMEQHPNELPQWAVKLVRGE